MSGLIFNFLTFSPNNSLHRTILLTYPRAMMAIFHQNPQVMVKCLHDELSQAVWVQGNDWTKQLKAAVRHKNVDHL